MDGQVFVRGRLGQNSRRRVGVGFVVQFDNRYGRLGNRRGRAAIGTDQSVFARLKLQRRAALGTGEFALLGRRRGLHGGLLLSRRAGDLALLAIVSTIIHLCHRLPRWPSALDNTRR